MKIGLISDTHGHMDDRILHHLRGCDAIVHAGDIGQRSVCDALTALAPLYCVYGNIDDAAARKDWPEYQLLEWEGMRWLIIHIAGPVGSYNAPVRELIIKLRPQVLVCGHSHLLKVVRDERFDVLYINPGAAGMHGFHKVRTLCTLHLEAGNLSDLQVVELGPRSSKAIG